MTAPQPTAKLDERYSSPNSSPVDWQSAAGKLEQAEIYWVTTIRANGRPHVVPLIAVWLNDAIHFSTGQAEQKSRNLAGSSRCIVSTGCNAMGEGLDIVVEGEAVRVTDNDALTRIAAAYEAKYGPDWHFNVSDGTFVSPRGDVADVYRVAPDVAFGFGRDGGFTQTRWTF
jgi:hypothetical protein